MTHRMRMVWHVAGMASLAATSCVGAIADTAALSPSAPPAASAAAGAPTTGPAMAAPRQPGVSGGPGPVTASACAAAVSVEPGTIRMLNKREYGNTVRDLLGASGAADLAVAGFPPDTMLGFDNDAAALVASPALVEQLSSAATALAAAADLAALSPCSIAVGNDACATLFIQRFGRRAYRRPLSSEEVALYQGLYARARGASPPRTFEESLRLVIRAFLQSGPVLYRAEPSASPTGGVVKLGPWEIASRLSYFLWATMPDETLFAAAADGSLATTQGIETQAQRMIADPRARAVVAAFHRMWLDLDQLGGVTKIASAFPSGSAFADYPAARTSFIRETEKFTETVFWEAHGQIDRYLVSDVITVDAKLAQHYGLPGAAAQRFGLLTQGAILSRHSNPDRTSPTRRGAFVREHLLCQAAPPAPADVPPLPIVTGTTIRDRLAQHSAVPACAACHALMDPIGLGLEGYDTVGRYRTTEAAGRPLDTTGAINGASVTVAGKNVAGPFEGARALSERLAGSVELRRCVARQWFHFALGRADGPLDACTIERIAHDVDAAGGRPSEILAAIARSQALLNINTEKLP